MRAKKDVAAALAEKMLRSLAAQRQLGGDAYPLTLRRLAEVTEPTAALELVVKAAGTSAFKKQTLAIQPKNLDAPLALLEDAELIAGSAPALIFVLRLVCNAEKPTCDISKLKGKIPIKLRAFFAAAVQRMIDEQRLPADVGVAAVRKKKHLHLQQYPLLKTAEEMLAERLLQALKDRRQRGGNGYPSRVGDLFDEVAPSADIKLRKKAMAQPVFASHVVLATVASKKLPDRLVASAIDQSSLADSEGFLENLLKLVHTPINQLIGVAELKKAVVPALQVAFEASVARRLNSRLLPSTVGCLFSKKKPLLFLLEDVSAWPWPTHSEAPALSRGFGVPQPRAFAADDFSDAFDGAFQRLDREKGRHNFVSLVELRREVACNRQSFDVELRKLRVAGRYTLSAAEGRHGISPEERAAGIEEDGTLLLYVSRKLT
jgi:hypothetical protein